MKQMIKVFSFILFLGISVHSNATIIEATDNGWYTSEGVHNVDNANYIVGNHTTYDAEYRNFMVFDLSSVGTVSSAVLRAFLIGTDTKFGYNSQDNSELWELREVETSINELVNDTALNPVDVFNDLGEGTLFGDVTVSANDMGSYVEVFLNNNALSAISSSTGLWAIGGSLTTLSFGSTKELIFSNSHHDPRVELVLTEVSAPSGYAMILIFIFFLLKSKTTKLLLL